MSFIREKQENTMNETIEIKSDEKIKEIRTNLYTIHQYLLQKVISDEKLFYSKRINDVDDLYKEYHKIKNSPLNLCLRTFRWFNKYGLYFLLSILSLILIGIFLTYFFRFELMMLFISYDINTSFLMQFNSFIDNIVLYIADIYHSLILKVKSLSSY
jgi:hypothetical protein